MDSASLTRGVRDWIKSLREHPPRDVEEVMERLCEGELHLQQHNEAATSDSTTAQQEGAADSRTPLPPGTVNLRVMSSATLVVEAIVAFGLISSGIPSVLPPTTDRAGLSALHLPHHWLSQLRGQLKDAPRDRTRLLGETGRILTEHLLFSQALPPLRRRFAPDAIRALLLSLVHIDAMERGNTDVSLRQRNQDAVTRIQSWLDGTDLRETARTLCIVSSTIRATRSCSQSDERAIRSSFGRLVDTLLTWTVCCTRERGATGGGEHGAGLEAVVDAFMADVAEEHMDTAASILARRLALPPTRAPSSRVTGEISRWSPDWAVPSPMGYFAQLGPQVMRCLRLGGKGARPLTLVAVRTLVHLWKQCDSSKQGPQRVSPAWCHAVDHWLTVPLLYPLLVRLLGTPHWADLPSSVHRAVTHRLPRHRAGNEEGSKDDGQAESVELANGAALHASVEHLHGIVSQESLPAGALHRFRPLVAALLAVEETCADSRPTLATAARETAANLLAGTDHGVAAEYLLAWAWSDVVPLDRLGESRNRSGLVPGGGSNGSEKHDEQEKGHTKQPFAAWLGGRVRLRPGASGGMRVVWEPSQGKEADSHAELSAVYGEDGSAAANLGVRASPQSKGVDWTLAGRPGERGRYSVGPVRARTLVGLLQERVVRNTAIPGKVLVSLLRQYASVCDLSREDDSGVDGNEDDDVSSHGLQPRAVRRRGQEEWSHLSPGRQSVPRSVATFRVRVLQLLVQVCETMGAEALREPSNVIQALTVLLETLPRNSGEEEDAEEESATGKREMLTLALGLLSTCVSGAVPLSREDKLRLRSSLTLLRPLQSHGQPEVREMALTISAKILTFSTEESTTPHAASEDGAAEWDRHMSHMAELLMDKSVGVRAGALVELGRFLRHCRRAIPLRECLATDRVRRQALVALLLQQLEDTDAGVFLGAIRALEEVATGWSETVLPQLVRIVAQPQVRRSLRTRVKLCQVIGAAARRSGMALFRYAPAIVGACMRVAVQQDIPRRETQTLEASPGADGLDRRWWVLDWLDLRAACLSTIADVCGSLGVHADRWGRDVLGACAGIITWEPVPAVEEVETNTTAGGSRMEQSVQASIQSGKTESWDGARRRRVQHLRRAAVFVMFRVIEGCSAEALREAPTLLRDVGRVIRRAAEVEQDSIARTHAQRAAEQLAELVEEFVEESRTKSRTLHLGLHPRLA